MEIDYSDRNGSGKNTSVRDNAMLSSNGNNYDSLATSQSASSHSSSSSYDDEFLNRGKNKNGNSQGLAPSNAMNTSSSNIASRSLSSSPQKLSQGSNKRKEMDIEKPRSNRLNGGNGDEEDEETLMKSFLEASVSSSYEGDDEQNKKSRKQESNEAPPSTSSSPSPYAEEIQLGKKSISTFLKSVTCYKLAPKSGKVVVFDSAVPLRFVYYALVEHDLPSAPLFDSQLQKLTGMVTLSDFVNVLRLGYRFNELTSILDNYSPKSWRELVRAVRSNPGTILEAERAGLPALKSIRAAALNPRASSSGGLGMSGMHDVSFSSSRPTFITIGPDQTMYDACSIMKRHRIHSLPLLAEDGSSHFCLSIITQSRVLNYIVNNFRDDRRLFDIPIHELRFGTYTSRSGIKGNGRGQEPIVVYPDTTLLETLDLLAIHEISSVPVVNQDTMAIVDVYSNENLLHLPTRADFDESGNAKISSILEDERNAKRATYEGGGAAILSAIFDGTLPMIDGPPYVHSRNTLYDAIIKFAESKSDRLIVVKSATENEFVGIVSLSDLLSFFLQGT